ncbi:large subunit ribosomal protein L19e [Enteropsectra breve]|nr:large subunit ribosomal protein L19e [Enteropsectra breve]KAI5150286.1 large subunit ribosomal protein L19e [Enteropsectra breve]
MSGVKTIRRLAKNIFNCGLNKVWMDPNEKEKIAAAQTREQVRSLIEENIIIQKPDNVNSRAHARALVEARNKGRHMGLGKRKGTKNARLPKRTIWMKSIRSMRATLKEMKTKGELVGEEYRKYKMQAKGNLFKNKNVMVDTILRKKAEAERLRDLEKQAMALKMNKTN